MRWYRFDILDTDGNQWKTIESLFQGSGDSRSPQFGWQGYIDTGATVGFDNQIKETTEIVARLQGLSSTVDIGYSLTSKVVAFKIGIGESIYIIYI